LSGGFCEVAGGELSGGFCEVAGAGEGAGVAGDHAPEGGVADCAGLGVDAAEVDQAAAAVFAGG